MNWLKSILIDVAILIVIALAAVLNLRWAWWIVVIYTPVMLLLKILVWSNPAMATMTGARKEEAPTIVLHLLYALSFILCLYGQYRNPVGRSWTYLAGAWALIWILSASLDMKISRSKKALRPAKAARKATK